MNRALLVHDILRPCAISLTTTALPPRFVHAPFAADLVRFGYANCIDPPVHFYFALVANLLTTFSSSFFLHCSNSRQHFIDG